MGSTGTESIAGDGLVSDHERPFQYQPALDGIRALAVLGVMAYHDAYAWAKGGFLGVDAFFVLSGFLITSLLVLECQRARSIAMVAFWGRRIRRLLPALLLVIVFVAVYAVIAVPSQQLDKVRGDGLAGLLYVANWRFIVTGQSYFDLFTAPSPFRHLWSLAIEEQFYLVWPIVVLGCLRVARGRLRVLVGVCVAGIVASVWLMSALFQADDPSRAYFGTDSRAHTILVGCLLALLLLVWKPTSRGARISMQVLGVVGGLGALWAWHAVGDVQRGYYGLGSLAYAVAIAAVIAAAVQPGRGLLRTPLSFRPLRWIGTISYGLYLWHWPIDVWLVEWRLGLGPTALNLLRLAVTFAAATASYYLVELPIRRGRFFGVRRPSLRWIGSAGVVLVALTLVISTAGATNVPSYFGDASHPFACPQAGAVSDAQSAMRKLGPPEVDPDGRGLRVLLVGDSVACSFWPGLKVVGKAAGWRVDQGAVIACGIASGEVVSGAVRVPPNTWQCPNLVGIAVDFSVRRSRPDVVLWLSSWERSDLKVRGRTLVAGTKAWERALQHKMDKVLARLERTDAHVVIAMLASTVPGIFNHPTDADAAAQDAAFQRLDGQLLRFTSRHPANVTLVDLAGKVCPGGPPCPIRVDGISPRPLDGGHYSPEGAVWAMRWLLPYIEQAGEKHAAGT